MLLVPGLADLPADFSRHRPRRCLNRLAQRLLPDQLHLLRGVGVSQRGGHYSRLLRLGPQLGLKLQFALQLPDPGQELLLLLTEQQLCAPLCRG